MLNIVDFAAATDHGGDSGDNWTPRRA